MAKESKEKKENMRLRRVLSECVTTNGAFCFSGSKADNYRNTIARLNYISEIASYAINYEEEK